VGQQWKDVIEEKEGGEFEICCDQLWSFIGAAFVWWKLRNVTASRYVDMPITLKLTGTARVKKLWWYGTRLAWTCIWKWRPRMIMRVKVWRAVKASSYVHHVVSSFKSQISAIIGNNLFVWADGGKLVWPAAPRRTICSSVTLVHIRWIRGAWRPLAVNTWTGGMVTVLGNTVYTLVAGMNRRLCLCCSI